MQTQDLEKRPAQLKREVPTRGFERHLLIVNTAAELQSPTVRDYRCITRTRRRCCG
ncbi:MAG: hypothetical protein JXR84_24400 [Anaerolineae bacterium]|nr:hypothetical protein [Anaerolineae bacterium]